MDYDKAILTCQKLLTSINGSNEKQKTKDVAAAQVLQLRRYIMVQKELVSIYFGMLEISQLLHKIFLLNHYQYFIKT